VSLIDAVAMRASTSTSLPSSASRRRGVPLTGVSATRLPGASASAAVSPIGGERALRRDRASSTAAAAMRRCATDRSASRAPSP